MCVFNISIDTVLHLAEASNVICLIMICLEIHTHTYTIELSKVLVCLAYIPSGHRQFYRLFGRLVGQSFVLSFDRYLSVCLCVYRTCSFPHKV